MERAEEMAMLAYPDIVLHHLGEGVVAKQGHLRNAYMEGYRQAIKDMKGRSVYCGGREIDFDDLHGKVEPNNPHRKGRRLTKTQTARYKKHLPS